MRETDADATGTNQSNTIWIFCGKLRRCPVHAATRRIAHDPRGKSATKMKDPSGGTTGRVKAIWGAWGGWALAPNTADGGNYRSHIFKSRHPAERSRRSAIFLTIQFDGDCPEFTAPQAYWLYLQPIFPMPSTARRHSVRGSRKRYPQPRHFLRRACRWQPAEPSTRRPLP